MGQVDTTRERAGRTPRVLGFVLNNKAILILLLMIIILAFTSNVFFTSTNLINVARQIAVSGILAVGFTVVIASGGIDLSVGFMLGFIGVVTALVAEIPGVPFPLPLLIGVALGAACGYVNAQISLYFKITPFIVTIATGQVFRGGTLLLTNGVPISIVGARYLAVGQGYVARNLIGPFIPIPVIILAAITFVLAVFITYTKPGRQIILVGGNAEAARVSGISTTRIRIMSFMITGACVAIASFIMNGRVGSAQPTAGMGMEMDAVAAVVIGGTSLHGGYGKIVGSVIGCLIVGFINNGLNLLHVNPFWQIAAKGLIILFAVILDVQTSQIRSIKKRII